MMARAALFHSPPVSKIANPGTAAAAREAFSPAPITEHMPWHSPVPYLFRGLAAMLGLIAFALLILACSYWKLSGEVNGGDRDVEGGSDTKGDGSSDTQAAPPLEEKFLVIMAGDARPTFLATPASNRPSSSFNEGKHNVNDGNGEEFREIQLNQLHVLQP